jgi:hypothetical protein
VLIAGAIAIAGYLPWTPFVSGKGYLWMYPPVHWRIR